MGLMQDILDTRVDRNNLTIFWLGQNSFIFKTSRTLVGIDLYLSRVYDGDAHVHVEPPLYPGDVVLDYMFSTHDHLDHLDPYTVPGILERSPDAVSLSTPEGRDHYIRLGVPADQAIGMKAGETIRLSDFEVTAFYSIDPREKPDTTHYGFLFRFPPCTVYNMGDSSLNMARDPLSILNPISEAKPDIAMLPIIGDYPGRKPEQALAFAKIIKPKIVIPTHYGCFESRNMDPQAFVELFHDEPDIEPVVIGYKGKYMYHQTSG